MLRKTETQQQPQVEKKNEKLTEAFVLWEKKSKNGLFYLTGVTSSACDEVKRLIAFYKLFSKLFITNHFIKKPF